MVFRHLGLAVPAPSIVSISLLHKVTPFIRLSVTFKTCCKSAEQISGRDDLQSWRDFLGL